MRFAALLCLAFGACIPMMPAGSSSTAGSPSSASPGEPMSAGGPPPSASSSAPSAPSAPAAPTTVSVSIHTSCPQTVKVFYGEKPGFSSGTKSSLDSNSIESHTFRPGEQLWIIDDHENGITSTTISAGTRELEVNCTSIAAR